MGSKHLKPAREAGATERATYDRGGHPVGAGAPRPSVWGGAVEPLGSKGRAATEGRCGGLSARFTAGSPERRKEVKTTFAFWRSSGRVDGGTGEEGRPQRGSK